MLLLLDNLEQVVEAAPQLAELGDPVAGRALYERSLALRREFDGER